jgi:hypothetical protein
MKLILSLFVFITIFFLESCGYLFSGTWEDDNKNWTRAYNQPLPDSINLIHSWYWRSPHWTLEQALYFETTYNEVIKKTFISDSTVKTLNYKDTINIDFFNQRPKWFIPKPYKFYHIWRGCKGEYDHFIFLIDKENEHMFWTDYEL